jgi:isopentenyl diphosphate isomerase/L-lactate dehydrogenase-like FMN-dependent dehydrogenase
VLRLLREELVTAMLLSGCATVADAARLPITAGRP